MGKDNRTRRAAKAKARAAAEARKRSADTGRARPSTGDRPRASGSGGGSWRPFDADPPPPPGGATDLDQVVGLLHAVVLSHLPGRKRDQPKLQALRAIEPATVHRATEVVLQHVIDAAWTGGWQPAELHRQAKRGCDDAAATRLIHLAMAVDHANRRASTLDPRWMAQVDQLRLPESDGRPGFVRRWVVAEGLDHPVAVAVLVQALANLVGLGTLEPILPPPGSDGSAFGPGVAPPRGGEADPLLERIRGLLAKAESTTYEAEASALTAKAQELMTRHAIDAALVASRSHSAEELPVLIRLPIDAPYADTKALLLQTVAGACRCRSISLGGLGLSTVAGFADDVASTEMLFTSLLLQAQAALAGAAKSAPPGTRVRSQSYRSAFLLAYAQRIGDRLEEVNQRVLAEAEGEHGSSLLPVLRSRADVVDGFVSEHFGSLTSSKVRGGWDAAGWASGRAAADVAQLNAGDLHAGR